MRITWGAPSARLPPFPQSRRIDVNSPAPYFHWGFILISLPNLVLIAVMVALFIAALIVPFPHGAGHRGRDDDD